MPYLRLRDLRSGAAREYESAEVRVGRDPDLELSLTGEGTDVVSGTHVRFVYRVRRWWIEDMGSRNGTYVGERCLKPGQAEVVAPGALLRLGKTGPRLKVEAAASLTLDATILESPADLEQPPEPAHAAAPPRQAHGAILKIVFEDAASGQRYRAEGAVVRIGRAADCQVRPLGTERELLSRHHAELALTPDGTVIVRDARSVNGTFLNAEFLDGDGVLKEGDQIALGEEGPVLIVEELAVSAPGGLTTLLVRRVAREVSQGTSARVRQLIWSMLAVIVTAVSGLYILEERREQATAAALEEQRQALDEQREQLEDYRKALAAQQATTDSVLYVASAEYERLSSELFAATERAAPASVIDSLRGALIAADERTQALEASLARSQDALRRQLAAGDSARRQADAEVARLRAELERATQERVSPGLVDSLRRAIREAEEQSGDIGAQLRAVSGVNLAAVAQANQGAVGLVTVFQGLRLFDGSGFVITPSGHFVTNRHVVNPDGKAPDSVFVTMADERFMEPADVIAVAPAGQPDLAVVRIRDYSGPHIERVDWSGRRATQGEPAALIGFPAGLGAALDQTRTARTSMSAGIFSQVTAESIRFDGFTVEGSSGSPVFNATGEVVGVHRGSLRGATGLGFAVPVTKLILLLTPEVKAELGIE
ncbi:MAG: FHA domain-containing protein [Gemmatimonadota bacterium]|nr:MAG: FHA domain-containing protein [Gemmatimonadota bacterium]